MEHSLQPQYRMPMNQAEPFHTPLAYSPIFMRDLEQNRVSEEMSISYRLLLGGRTSTRKFTQM